MGRLNYNYKNKYLATVSTRYDGSSVLAEGHKWVAVPFRSAGMAPERRELPEGRKRHHRSETSLWVGEGRVIPAAWRLI